MAANLRHSTSSPRNHLVDENEGLARKKARLSEEEKGDLTDDGVIVEAVPPEDIGTNFENAIEIEDDLSMDFSSYSEDFDILADPSSPLDAIQHLEAIINSNQYLEPELFVSFANALDNHVKNTATQGGDWKQHYLQDEAHFFGRLALVTVRMLDTGDLFEPNVDCDNPVMRKAFDALLAGLENLCRRIVPLLPEALTTTLSRRDSTQTPARQQDLPGLYYLMLAIRVTTPTTATLQVFYDHDRHDRLNLLVGNIRGRFFQGPINTALPTIIKGLSGNMRELKDTWYILKDTLALYQEAVFLLDGNDLHPDIGVEDVIGIVNVSILPAISEKHPRALPPGFHNYLITFGTHTLQAHMVAKDESAAGLVYERFVKSDTDAVIPHSKDYDSTSSALMNLCSGDKNILVRLLSTSWAIQAAHSFIRSDVMDVRNVGITSLRQQLVDLYNKEKNSLNGFDHPVVQFAVRFLRQNEITAYIFGPESRAGLVVHSADIICFLAATSTYTDAETDIIWKACSTSVEADFVKASLEVLEHMMGFLDFQHLIYIARRYSSIAPERLDAVSVTFLERLLRTLEDKSAADASDSLAVVFAAIDVLKVANDLHQSHPMKERLRKSCRASTNRLRQPNAPLDVRTKVYCKYIPEIQNQSEGATTAIEVLNMFLAIRLASSEVECILAMLPVSAAVDEFCDFVDSRRTEPFSYSSIFAADIRLVCIARLMALASTESAKPARDRLFEFALGESALCNEARNQAWIKLYEMASAPGQSSAASNLWREYMKEHVPSLRADLATGKLIEFVSMSLKAAFSTEDVKGDLTRIFQFELWKTLIRFATTSTDPYVIDLAAKVIMELLFDCPSSFKLPSNEVALYQAEFIRGHVERLRQGYQQIIQSQETPSPHELFQGIRLLSTVLEKSKASASANPTVEQNNILDLSDIEHELDIIDFTAYIHGAHAQPTKVYIRSSQTAKVSDLIDKLCQRTNTRESRVILNGKEVRPIPDRTLPDAGVGQSSVIMVRPKYSSESDIGKIFTYSNPVEQAIVEQFDALESFLDGPQDIAEKAYFFLINLRQSPRTRSKVSSTSATVDEVLPSERLWRSLFSLRVLQCHLQDFARLGVADDDFINRTVALLTSAMLDESRPFQPLLAHEISVTYNKFLQESARIEDGGHQLELDPRIISSMISTINHALALPPQPNLLPGCGPPIRTATVMATYGAMATACRTCPPLWEVLSNDPGFVKLHGSLLLDADPGLSSEAAKYMRGVCYDVTIPGTIPNFYWHAVIPSLPTALRSNMLAEHYFGLVIDILNADAVTQYNEVQMRNLIDMLVSELWSYRHAESIGFPVVDKAMAGLIRLLGVAVTILKSFKKPLQLQGLSTQLFRQLLFPPFDDIKRNPLITLDTRELAFNVFRWSFEGDNDYDNVLNIALEATEKASREVGATFPGQEDWFRPPWKATGLLNLGMTCYMNSLLQQLFFNLQFRKFILQQPIFDMSKQATLAQIQTLFGSMQESTDPVANTTALAQSLNVQVGNQEDVHTFYTALLSRLDENLPDANTKQALSAFFTGKSVTQIRGDCGHVSSRTEPFTELSVTVKNKGSLFESLNEFVQGEPLEGANKYKCMTCDAHDGGRLVNAMRRTCLEDVPDNLTFCLKRFTYESMLENESKVNDRFEFPVSIDMEPFKRVYLEDPDTPRVSDDFDLVGVIVHQGSLQYGHYWSFVRTPGATDADTAAWVCLEDNRFLRCKGGIREVQEQCFGGPRVSHGLDRSDNAYVLFYQRKTYIADAQAIDVVPEFYRLQYQIQPAVKLPASQGQRTAQHNKWRQHIESIFSGDFSSFMIWFLERSRSVLESRTTDLSDQEDTDTTDADGSRRLAHGQIEAMLGSLINNYATRVLLGDPDAEKRLDPFMTALGSLVEASPATAGHILANFGVDRFGFANTVRNENDKVRQRLFEGIWKCMSHLRDHDVAKYNEISRQLLHSHASIVGLELDLAFGKWDEYLKFAVKYAQLGVRETGFVLESDYLTWALDVLQLRFDQEIRKSHMPLNTWMRTNELDLSMLFDFISNLLRTHIDLTVDTTDLPRFGDQRTRTATGWLLEREEVEHLFKDRVVNNHRLWILLMCAARFCEVPERWQEYNPGKLVGLLASNKVHINIAAGVTEFLGRFCDYEEQKLEPLLALMLHYCLNRSDDCQTIMKAFTKTLLQWTGFEKDAIMFFDQAYSIVPVVVVECMTQWTPTFLNAGKSQIRNETHKFIHERVFNIDPLTDDASFDATRIRTTRALVTQLCKILRLAYHREIGRGKYEPMIATLQQAENYLTELLAEITRQRENGVRLGSQVIVESDEARATVAEITRFFAEIGDWEAEMSLPTRTIDVRRSVEEETEVSEGSEADLDELSSDADAL